jgi:hypothetical protein
MGERHPSQEGAWVAEDTISDEGVSPESASEEEALQTGRVRRIEAVQSAIGRVVEPAHLELLALTGPGLAVAAAWGIVWLGVVTVAFAIVIDWTLAHPRLLRRDWLRRAGFGLRTRALVRSLAMTVAFGVGSDDTTMRLYAVIAVVVHATWLLFSALTTRVINTQPAMGITGIGQSLELRYFYARARRRRTLGGTILLALEWLTAVGLWLTAPTGERPLATGLVVAAGVAATAAFGVLAVVWSTRFLRSGRVQRYEEELLAELEALAPEVLVYMTAAAKGQSSYILNQWLPAFDRMPRPGVIIVRESHNVTPITKTNLPILYAPKTRDVERFVVPSARLALYPANGGRNVHLVREAGIRHIFLNHGDSDKATSANPVSRLYDEVWVAGEAAIDRYEAAGIDIPRERFAIVGRPQVDALPVGKRADGSPPCVLYAPTFEGHYEEVNYSSLEFMGVEMIRRILTQRPDISIIFKPHPYTGMERKGMGVARLEVMRLLDEAPDPDRHIIAQRDKLMTLNDCFELADVLISDISSVVTDFLHTERPIMTSNPKGLTHDEFKQAFPTQAASSIIDPDLETFLTNLDAALGPDPLYSQRLEMKRYVLGDLRNGPLQAFCDQIDRAYDDAVAKLARVRNTFKWSEEHLAVRPKV